jgi:hypothetical protein
MEDWFMGLTSTGQVVPLRIKVVFWILIGGLSVLLAEVVPNSTPFPFFTLWGLISVVPLYSLHVLMLAYFTFGKHRVTFPILFITGAILGMYEAYITKVLWDPTWGDKNFEFAGIYLLQTIVLVLFWHPFMAYVLPVFLAENLFSDSNETFLTLPKKIQNMLSQKWITTVAIFSIYCAMYKSFGTLNWKTALLSSAANTMILFGIAFLWIRIKGDSKLTLRDLLPSKAQAFVLGIFLLLIYLGMGFFVRPEALSHTIGPHLTVWVIYAVLFILLFSNIERAPDKLNELQPSPIKNFTFRTGLIFAAIFITLSAFFFIIKGLAMVLILISWLAGCILGFIIVIRSARALYVK